MKPAKNKYNQLLDDIGIILQLARENAVKAVNVQLVTAYWNIGKYIVEYEQEGKERAEYATELLKKLSKDLKLRYGKGFGISNLQYMRLFYIKYPKFRTPSGKSGRIYQTLSGKSEKHQTVSGILTWSHYCELLGVSDNLARNFYEKQSLRENWSFRELKRQVDSALFQRLALSKDKKGVLGSGYQRTSYSNHRRPDKRPLCF